MCMYICIETERDEAGLSLRRDKMVDLERESKVRGEKENGDLEVQPVMTVWRERK